VHGGVELEPARDLDAGVRRHRTGVELPSGKRFVTAAPIEPQTARAREVESYRGQVQRLCSALLTVLRLHHPEERIDALDPAKTRIGGIEIQVLILPRARDAHAIDERGIHLKPAIVMLELSGDRVSVGPILVAGLRAGSAAAGTGRRLRMRRQEGSVHLKMF